MDSVGYSLLANGGSPVSAEYALFDTSQITPATVSLLQAGTLHIYLNVTASTTAGTAQAITVATTPIAMGSALLTGLTGGQTSPGSFQVLTSAGMAAGTVSVAAGASSAAQAVDLSAALASAAAAGAELGVSFTDATGGPASVGAVSLSGTATVTLPFGITGGPVNLAETDAAPFQPLANVTVGPDGSAYTGGSGSSPVSLFAQSSTTTDLSLLTPLLLAVTGDGHVDNLSEYSNYFLTLASPNTHFYSVPFLLSADGLTATLRSVEFVPTKGDHPVGTAATVSFGLTPMYGGPFIPQLPNGYLGSVTVTAVAAPPVVTGLTGAAGADSGPYAVFPTLSVTETDYGNPPLSATLSLTPGAGTLSGTGVTAGPGNTYVLAAATQPQLQAELSSILLTPVAGPAAAIATLTLTVTDTVSGLSATGTQTLTTTPAVAAPVITGVPPVIAAGTKAPFAAATVTNAEATPREFARITLLRGGQATDAAGTLSGANLQHAGVGTYVLDGTTLVTPAKLTQDLNALQFNPADAGGVTFQLLVADSAGLSAIATESLASPPCYCPGTHIRTPGGERAIEDLAVGDHVLTMTGAAEPIRWIGRRAYTGRFLASHLRPIRLRAGCLGNGLPLRDLRVSPRHALLLDGVLIAAELLVNGTTIVREWSCPAVEYIHLELARHDIILAEGASAETFLDDDTRAQFHNVADAPQDPATGGYCAPRLEGGSAIEAIRRRLAARAAA